MRCPTAFCVDYRENRGDCSHQNPVSPTLSWVRRAPSTYTDTVSRTRYRATLHSRSSLGVPGDTSTPSVSHSPRQPATSAVPTAPSTGSPARLAETEPCRYRRPLRVASESARRRLYRRRLSPPSLVPVLTSGPRRQTARALGPSTSACTDSQTTRRGPSGQPGWFAGVVRRAVIHRLCIRPTGHEPLGKIRQPRRDVKYHSPDLGQPDSVRSFYNVSLTTLFV